MFSHTSIFTPRAYVAEHRKLLVSTESVSSAEVSALLALFDPGVETDHVSEDESEVLVVYEFSPKY